MAERLAVKNLEQKLLFFFCQAGVTIRRTYARGPNAFQASKLPEIGREVQAPEFQKVPGDEPDSHFDEGHRDDGPRMLDPLLAAVHSTIAASQWGRTASRWNGQDVENGAHDAQVRRKLATLTRRARSLEARC